MQKSEFVKNQLKEKLLEVLPKQHRNNNDSKQRKFLIDCIEEYGYIQQRKQENVISRFEKQIASKSTPIEQEYEYNPYEEYHDIAGPSYQQIQTSSCPGNNCVDKRLQELQNRGITPRETELGRFSEKIDIALNKMYQDYDFDVEKVKRFAIDLYNKLLDYYIDNVFNLKTNAANLKRGYIALIVWYSLLQFNINVPQTKLANYFDKTLYSYLFEADKNLNKIFNDLPKPLNNLCGLKQMLLETFGQETINQILGIVKKFDDSPKYNAAAIYFVCNKKNKAFTLEFLEKNCGVSQTTISKAVQEIKQMV